MGSNPKILFVTLEFNKEIAGGIGRVVNSLVRSFGDKIELQIMLIKDIQYIIKSVRLYQIRNHHWKETKYLRLGFTLLEDLIHAEKYHAVHLFYSENKTAAVAKFIKKKFPGVPIIYSCHSLMKYECTIRSNYPIDLKHEETIIRNIDHLHLLNRTSLKYFQIAYPSVAGQIPYSIIPNGIAEESFQKKDHHFERTMSQLLDKKGKITVLCMSRWTQGKGLEYLLKAIPIVVARYPNIQFLIAGRKPVSWEYQYKKYLGKIDQMIAPLSDYVIPLGWLDDEQRNTLFTLADIWVMPSLLEYFPYSILEPMIARIPIISSRIDCVQEMLCENEECLFYQPEEPEQLADQILKLVHRPELRRKLAHNAYQKAKENYQWGSISGMYLKMYETVLNQRINEKDQKTIRVTQ